MEIKLHANATTTPRIRRYLQQSDKSDRELAVELGISVTTVRRWRNRDQVSDNHTAPKVIHKAMRQEQVALVNALRDILGAPLDDLLLMVNDVLGIAVSRATLNRYLKPAAAKQKGPLAGEKGAESGYYAPYAGTAPFAFVAAYGRRRGAASALGARAGERLVLCPALCGTVASTTEYLDAGSAGGVSGCYTIY